MTNNLAFVDQINEELSESEFRISLRRSLRSLTKNLLLGNSSRRRFW